MEKSKAAGIGFFEKYLTVWVVLCMVVGVLIGKFLPVIPSFLGRFEYANVSIPIAVLIWLMKNFSKWADIIKPIIDICIIKLAIPFCHFQSTMTKQILKRKRIATTI